MNNPYSTTCATCLTDNPEPPVPRAERERVEENVRRIHATNSRVETRARDAREKETKLQIICESVIDYVSRLWRRTVADIHACRTIDPRCPFVPADARIFNLSPIGLIKMIYYVERARYLSRYVYGSSYHNRYKSLIR